MKVTSNKLPSTMPSSTSAASEASKAKASGLEAALEGKTKSSADIGSSSKVELSSRAQHIKKAKELATPGKDDIDEAKVARLQAMIDSGGYKVNAEAIADRLLDEHTKMPG
jgi:negative regulator of flagellin synthesis FlgM